MPAADVFIDSNIFLYIHDRSQPEKRLIATAALKRIAAERRAVTNLQVLNEVTQVLIRKKWFDSPSAVFSVVDAFATFGNAPLSNAQVDLARAVHVKTGFSWWDCVLLAAAIDIGCTYFITEDLADQQRVTIGYGKALTIVDPFAHSPSEFLLPR